MNTLRLVDGVPTNYFEQRTGLKLSAIRPTLDTLVAKGLLSPSPENLLTTPKGLEFLNAVLEIMSENTLIAEGEK
jgi:Coproporphyrinogen III oxidase and related Fe-S oxidoreductases